MRRDSREYLPVPCAAETKDERVRPAMFPQRFFRTGDRERFDADIPPDSARRHLNPDELLNRDLKAALSKTPAAKRNGELEEHAKSHMRSIQKQPEKIKALFHKESVKYAG